MRKDFTTYHLHRPIVMGYNLKLGCGLEKLRTSFAFSLALTSSSSSLQDIVCEYSLPLFPQKGKKLPRYYSSLQIGGKNGNMLCRRRREQYPRKRS